MAPVCGLFTSDAGGGGGHGDGSVVLWALQMLGQGVLSIPVQRCSLTQDSCCTFSLLS